MEGLSLCNNHWISFSHLSFKILSMHATHKHDILWHWIKVYLHMVFVGNKTYIMQVMTTTNNLTIEWFGFVHPTNLNMSKKFVDMFMHIYMGNMIFNYFNFKNLTISSTICTFCPLKFDLLKMMVPFYLF